MPVKVWTGLPGAGKTAAMVAAIIEFKAKHPERPVYAININGLSESVAEPLTLEQLEKWWELPPESLICIDEAQEDDYFPLDHGKPKEWVKRISKVRHEGMDFWFTTQHPALMSVYVRRLVDQHVHCVRKFNTNVVSRYQWGRCMDAPEKGSAQKAGIESLGKLPAHVFDLYKSSNAHNMKKRIPRKVYFFGALLAVAVVAVVAVPVLVKRAQSRNLDAIRDGAGVKAAGSAGALQSGSRSADETMRQDDFAKWMKPRIDGLPWSAPMFDQLQVTAKPRLFCVAVEDGRCSCMTEQGTKYAVPAPRCRAMVSNGVYNPFVDGSPDTQERQSGGRVSDQPQARSYGAALPSGVSPAFDKPRVTAQAYMPPELVPWNPDAFGSDK